MPCRHPWVYFKYLNDYTFLQVTVMLMSLKAGNLGLNMVAACHVILLDLWWNPTTEDQAVDRAHRIGQTRPVTVSRITIKNTVEDRILALQVLLFTLYLLFFLPPSIGFVLSFHALRSEFSVIEIEGVNRNCAKTQEV